MAIVPEVEALKTFATSGPNPDLEKQLIRAVVSLANEVERQRMLIEGNG